MKEVAKYYKIQTTRQNINNNNEVIINNERRMGITFQTKRSVTLRNKSFGLKRTSSKNN